MIEILLNQLFMISIMLSPIHYSIINLTKLLDLVLSLTTGWTETLFLEVNNLPMPCPDNFKKCI